MLVNERFSGSCYRAQTLASILAKSQIFLSWSGERSKALAKAFRIFLEDVNHRIEPWMSEADIKAGERLASRLAVELNNTYFGVLCITPENINSSWLLFEA